MELLTAELRAQLPPLYTQKKSKDPTVHWSFLCPAIELDLVRHGGKNDEGEFLFFGYVIGHEEEWGYFALSEMESVRGPGGLTIERDIHFKPGPFSEVIERYRGQRGG